MDGAISIAILVGVVSFIVTAVQWFCHRLEKGKPFPDLPMPPSHWLFGHLALVRDFATGQRTLAIDHANEHGQTGFWLVRKPVICVGNYQDAVHVLKNEQGREHLGLYKRHTGMAFGTKGILSLAGRDWKLYRAAINKAMNRESLAQAKQATLQVIQVAVASIKEQIASTHAPTSMLSIMKLITMDIFGRMAFSTDFGCCRTLKPPPVVKSFDYLNAQLTARLENPLSLPNLFYFFPTERNHRFRQERSILTTFVTQAIAQARAAPKDDFLSVLLAATQNPESHAPKEQEQILADVLVSLMFAGYDTTSITLSYSLYLVSGDAQVEQHCLDEFHRVGDLAKPEEMVYLAAVVREALRLYPPANATVRKLSKPLTLSGGYVAPAGTAFFIPIWSIQRYEKVFPEPETFRPDRWVMQDKHGRWVERPEDDDSGSIQAAVRGGFLAFSAGARSCAGSRLAMNEAVAIFAALLQNFRFEAHLETDTVVPEMKGIVQTPQGGMAMRVYVR